MDHIKTHPGITKTFPAKIWSAIPILSDAAIRSSALVALWMGLCALTSLANRKISEEAFLWDQHRNILH